MSGPVPSGASTVASTPVPVDTLGWETVLALRLDVFDRLCARPADPRRFKASFDADGSGGGDTCVSWSFGPWVMQDVYGASFDLVAPLLALEIAPPPGATDIPDAEGFVGSCSLSANMALVGGGAAEGEPWAEVSVDQSAGNTKALPLVQYALQQWFQTAEAATLLAPLSSAMASVPSEDSDRWYATKVSRLAGVKLAPSANATTSDVASEARGKAVALLAMTQSTDIVGARVAVSPNIIQSDNDASYVISAPLFLSALVRPALAATFHTSLGTSEMDFAVVDGIEIVNKISLTLDVHADGKSYTGTIPPEQLHVRIEPDALVLTIERMTFDVDVLGVRLQTIVLRLVERLKPRLVPAADDPTRCKLLLIDDGAPDITTGKEDSLGLILTETAVLVAVAIAEALINKFVPGAMEESYAWSKIGSRLFAGIVNLLLQGGATLLTWLPDHISDIESGDLKSIPHFDTLMDSILENYSFGAPLRLVPTSARFAGALVIDLRTENSVFTPSTGQPA